MVVLPLVPVMPTVVRSRLGRPYTTDDDRSEPATGVVDHQSGARRRPRRARDRPAAPTAPVRDGLGGMVVAVERGAAQAGEQRAGPDVPRVVGHPDQFDVRSTAADARR